MPRVGQVIETIGDNFDFFFDKEEGKFHTIGYFYNYDRGMCKVEHHEPTELKKQCLFFYDKGFCKVKK